MSTTQGILNAINSAPLTAADRCDRCGAQAYLRAEPIGGGELLFCSHHAREHGPALIAAGAAFHDETRKLDDLEQQRNVYNEATDNC